MLLDDLAAYLQSAGVGTVSTTIFKHTLPDSPDTCLAVIESSGLTPALDHTSAMAAYERPGVRIVARGVPHSGYVVARNLAEDAYQALLAMRNMTINSVQYLSATPLQSPFDAGVDPKARPVVGFSVVVTKELTL